MNPVDLQQLAQTTDARGPVWTDVSDDLNVNLLVFDRERGVDEHVNAEVDVLLIVVNGSGIVTIDGESHSLGPGTTLIVQKGASRSILASSDRFAYISCHRKRPGLMPR